jgi:hypothetical protein
MAIRKPACQFACQIVYPPQIVPGRHQSGTFSQQSNYQQPECVPKPSLPLLHENLLCLYSGTGNMTLSQYLTLVSLADSKTSRPTIRD